MTTSVDPLHFVGWVWVYVHVHACLHTHATEMQEKELHRSGCVLNPRAAPAPNGRHNMLVSKSQRLKENSAPASVSIKQFKLF